MRLIVPALGVILAASGLGIVAKLSADPGAQIAVTDQWVERVNYEPPNERQVKTEFSGTEAAPISGGGSKALLKGVKIKQFSVTGGNPQMIAETPECIYDRKRQEVTSSGPLKVHAQEGKLFLEGTGFLLHQTNSSLVISNDVHSILQISSGTNIGPNPATEISSQRGQFRHGQAIYLGAVRVNDPKMKLTSESLVADLPEAGMGQTNRPNHIVAETNVVIDFLNDSGEQTHATGQKAVYNFHVVDGATNEVLELTGNPRVELTNGWMTAEVFVMDRATGKLRGRDNFHFHYLAQNQPSGGEVKTNAPAPLDIFSDHFEFDLNTHLATFGGQVRADDGRIKVNAETLAVVLPKQEPGKTNRIDHLLAETNVVIDFLDEKTGQKIHATGQKAVYNYSVAGITTNQVLELTGNPAVETAKPAGWMTADVITVDRAQGRIWGVGNHHSVFKKQPGEPATMDTEIFSERFDFSMDTGLAVYRGKVRSYDPEMNLTGDLLTVKLAKATPGQTNRIESVHAEGNVAIDFVEQAFSAGDITNLTAFAARLQKPSAQDGVAQYLSAHLSEPTRRLLNDYHEGTNSPLQNALVKDLNRATQSGAIYEAARFANVYLSLDTTDLMRQQPLGIELIQLNRLLLLDAFRGEISRGPRGEKTHATGEQAVYLHKITPTGTNAVLELSGHPRLEKPSGWITAEQTIIDDRTTGICRFIGKPRFHTKLEGLTQNKLPGASKKVPE